MKRLQTSESIDAQGKMPKKLDANNSAEQLIYALNFIKMQAGMYPEGHSMISQGLVSVLDVLQEIFIFKGQVTIHVEDDALYVGEEILDEKNRNNRQFTKWLNDLYITSITLSRGLTKEELLKLQKILVMRTSDVLVLGDIEKFFADSRMPHIKVKGLDLSHFSSAVGKTMDRDGPKDKKADMKGPDAGYLGTAREKIGDREGLKGNRPTMKGSGLGSFSAVDEKIADRKDMNDKGSRMGGPDTGDFRPADGREDAGREASNEERRSEDELWRKFTAALVTQSQDKEAGKSLSPEYSRIDSRDFVKHLNEETISWDVFLNDYRSLIVRYLRSEDEKEKPTLENVIFRIDSLVKDFHPELQHQMLNVTEKELCSLPASVVKANTISCFNYETIAGILRGASEEKRGISPSLSLLFQKLSATHDESLNGSGKSLPDGSSPLDGSFASAKDIEKLIEREQYESYVPADYKEILDRKSKAADPGGTKENFIAEEHVHTIEDTVLNLQISKLLIALMDEKVVEEEYREISNYVTESTPELILSGDFSFLIDVINTYKRHAQEKSLEEVRKLADSGMTVFQNTEFLSRNLKEFFLQGISINSLIGFVVACGPKHVPWLLDLYLETRSPKGQAMIIEVLRHFPEEAVDSVVKKLPDTSVQFIRKLLILLQLIGDAGVIPYVRPFADHAEGAIRLEAIHTLLRFKDHDAKALLQRSVLSKDRSESEQAMVLACEYRIVDICVQLISRIRTGIILKKDLAFNEFLIPEVIKTNDPQIIQHLEKMAGTRWSLSPGRLSRTKMALLNAIELGSPPRAAQLIKKCLDSGNRQIKALCGELMKRESE